MFLRFYLALSPLKYPPHFQACTQFPSFPIIRKYAVQKQKLWKPAFSTFCKILNLLKRLDFVSWDRTEERMILSRTARGERIFPRQERIHSELRRCCFRYYSFSLCHGPLQWCGEKPLYFNIYIEIHLSKYFLRLKYISICVYLLHKIRSESISSNYLNFDMVMSTDFLAIKW